MKSYYEIFGIQPDATSEAVTAAYQRLQAQYQAERIRGLDEDIQRVARQRVQELEQAYAVLNDPQSRQEYDRTHGFGQPETPAAAPVAHAAQNQHGLSPRERWYAVGGVVLALLLIGVVWMLTDRTELPSVGEMNRRAPDISLPTLAGDELRLSDYRGQVVLVNFWGTWCEPCIRETPALQAAYTELKDQGLVIVGVNLTDDEIRQGNSLEDVQAFVDQFQVSYPIALDMEGEATRAFRVFPLPTSFFIDPAGNIRFVRVSEITADEVTVLFEELQAEATAQR
ncbi:MAG: redoxin domain-containing protein [Chloroflexaceae bacterium]|nr:redoxin domain-containing protein [Chloroflexaceae bacterium]